MNKNKIVTAIVENKFNFFDVRNNDNIFSLVTETHLLLG